MLPFKNILKALRFILKKLVGNNSTILALQLEGCGITNQGVRYLAHMLKTNWTLTELNLDGNDIGDQGLKLLADVLTSSNANLTRLSINGNQSVTDASVDSIISMIEHNPSIEVLQIMNCGFTGEGGDRLRELKNIYPIQLWCNAWHRNNINKDENRHDGES